MQIYKVHNYFEGYLSNNNMAIKKHLFYNSTIVFQNETLRTGFKKELKKELKKETN